MADTERSGLCVAAMVLGVLGLLSVPLGFVWPYYSTLGLLLALGAVAIGCGVAGVRQVRRFDRAGIGMAAIGLMCAIMGMALSTTLIFLALTVNAEM